MFSAPLWLFLQSAAKRLSCDFTVGNDTAYYRPDVGFSPGDYFIIWGELEGFEDCPFFEIIYDPTGEIVGSVEID